MILLKKVMPMCLSAVCLLQAEALSASERDSLFTKNWKFQAGCVANAEAPSFNDTGWRTLDLPHDWSVEPLAVQREGITVGPFSKMSPGGIDTGQTMGGEGWYRKTFSFSPEDKGKRIILYIEAAYNQSEIWVNGRKVKYNVYGYTPYKVDITDACHEGDGNVIAIKVINEGRNSRWYAGSGLFRHVWLSKVSPFHLDKWDTYVDASRVENETGIIRLSTVLHNQGAKVKEATVGIKIYAPSGKVVYTASEKATATNGSLFQMNFAIKNPTLWSVDTPYLYKAELTLKADGNDLDKLTVQFGIRTVTFSAEKGFVLNGKPLKLKGGCVHHDNGLLGAAAIRRADERKAELLKANGFNAVRCSHNTVSEAFLDACDKVGLLVIHETFDQWEKPKREQDYHRFFVEHAMEDLSNGIRRDRNHPSIIMWSLGNEIQERCDPKGEEIIKKLVETVHKYDTSRYTTAAVNSFWDNRNYKWENDSYRAFQHLDVAGYNYEWRKYEPDHKAYPKRVMYGSESFPKELAQNWNLVEKHPYVIGDFVWTAMDYLGEAGLGHASQLDPGEKDTQFKGWPWYNAWSGDLDLAGDKKPQSYYRDVVWGERKMAMAVHVPIAPGRKEVVNGWGWPDELLSWNWKGEEGRPLQVNVYSRDPEVKLYLNNKLVGTQATDRETYTATFTVPYAPGVLTAKGKGKSTVSLQTTGEPAAIRLLADRTTLDTSGEDLSYIKIEIVDKEGRVVPTASLPVTVSYTGKAKVIAGNGSFDDMKSFRSLTPLTFHGKAVAIVQPTGDPGTIEVKVAAKDLGEQSIILNVK